MTAMNKKILTLSFIIIVVGVLGFLRALGWWGNSETLKPKRGDIVESIYGLGTVTADKTYHLRTGMALSIQKIYVREGDLVQPGDALVNIEGRTLRSPIEGTATSIAYKDGELVTPQSAILTITNLEHLNLEVSLEQQSILRVKRQQNVYVSFESLRSERYEGVVASVYPRDNQFIVRIELKSWPPGVLPGMTADVAIMVGKKADALLIPLRSIVGGQVTRIRDGKKERVQIKLGVVDGEWAELISNNINESDELVARK